MKFDINRERFSYCLSHLDKFVAKKNKGGSLLYSCINFIVTEKKLELLAFSGDSAIKMYYGDVDCEDFSKVVEYSAIKKLVSLSSESVIGLTFNEAQLNIKDGKSKYSLSYYNNTEYSYVFDDLTIPEDILFSINVGKLSEIVQFLQPCIPQDKAYTFLKGIYYNGNFISTNTNSLAFIQHSEEEKEDSIFITQNGVNTICGLPKNLNIDLGIAGSSVYITGDDFTAFVPQLNSDFPKYDNILKRVSVYPNKVVIKRDILHKVTSKLIPFSENSIFQTATCTFDTETGITLTVHSEGKEGVEIIIPEEIILEETIEFILNLKRFNLLLSSFSGDTISIIFSNNNTLPLKITDDTNVVYIESVVVKGGTSTK